MLRSWGQGYLYKKHGKGIKKDCTQQQHGNGKGRKGKGWFDTCSESVCKTKKYNKLDMPR